LYKCFIGKRIHAKSLKREILEKDYALSVQFIVH
jgi:hypothetical protein